MNAPVNLNTPVEFSLPIKNYNEFYRFYLTEHRSLVSRRLHVAGSSIGLYFFSQAIIKRKAKYALYGLVSGYEHNKPASFKQPLYSFISDWRMLSDVVRGRLSLVDRKFDKIES